jgi:hypothetical protein
VGNMFSTRRPEGPIGDYLFVGNGGTAVLLSVLAMAGTSVAKTRRNFEAEKRFWLAVIDSAMTKAGWEIRMTAGSINERSR